jgi:hypothetical protein
MSSKLKRTGATMAVAGALLIAAVAALSVAPAASAAPPINATAPSTLNVAGTTAAGGTFTGTLTNLQFVNQNGALNVVGNLTGTLTNAAGAVLGNVTNLPVTLPVTAAQGGNSCQILDLTLGPLDLNLLGLVVHLDTVHLNITAHRGPGNLLGNLLCAVAHLLDGNSPTSGLAALLNRILSILG